MTRVILWLALAGVVLAGALYARGKDAIHTNRLGDAAIFEQLIENIHAGKGAVSNVFSATQNLIDKGAAGKPVPELLARPPAPAAEDERDMLRFHGYWSLFPIATLLALMPSSLLLAGVQTFCYLAVLAGAFYLVMRRTGQPLAALCFMPLVLMWPNWIGGFFGQFYPDRLFVPFAFALCCAVYFNMRPWASLLLAVLVAGLNERAGLIGGMLCVVLPFCRRVEPGAMDAGRRALLAPVLIGLGMLLYAYLYKKFFLANLYYDSFLPSGPGELYERFTKIDTFAPNAWLLMQASAVLLALALVNVRLGLLALLCMVPNIIGNIGGAEKVGWVTHYHTYYIPVVLFCACVGFADLVRRYRTRPLAWLLLGCAIAGAGWEMRRESSSGRLVSTEQVKSVFDSARNYRKGLPTGYDLRRELEAAVPPGSYVLTDELGTAMLHRRAQVNIFPIAIERADYLFFPCERLEGGDADSARAEVPAAWLHAHGFSTAHMQRFPGLGRCLLRRGSAPLAP